MRRISALVCWLVVALLQAPSAAPAHAVQAVGLDIRPGSAGPAPIKAVAVS